LHFYTFRTILLKGGIEKLIRKAKGMQGCKDAATAALRDLGLDDYNA
jgi:armadillo repeat-containing protein 6